MLDFKKKKNYQNLLFLPVCSVIKRLSPPKGIHRKNVEGSELLDYDEDDLYLVNPLSTNPAKWSNTLKQFVGKLPTNCLSVFVHFVKLALKGLIKTLNVKMKAIRVNQIMRMEK